MACTQFAVHYINWFPFKCRFWIKATMCLSRQNDPLMQMILQSSLWALYIETYSCTSQKKLAAQPRRLLKLLSWTFSCSAHFCCAFFKFHCFLFFLFSPCFCSFFHFNWVLFNFHYCFSIFPLCLFNFCSVLSTCVGSYSTSVSFIQLIFIFAIFIVFFYSSSLDFFLFMLFFLTFILFFRLPLCSFQPVCFYSIYIVFILLLLCSVQLVVFISISLAFCLTCFFIAIVLFFLFLLCLLYFCCFIKLSLFCFVFLLPLNSVLFFLFLFCFIQLSLYFSTYVRIFFPQFNCGVFPLFSLFLSTSVIFFPTFVVFF